MPTNLVGRRFIFNLKYLGRKLLRGNMPRAGREALSMAGVDARDVRRDGEDR